MSAHRLPAFPSAWVNESDALATAPDGQVVPPGASVQLPGMTLRDYFAAKAMEASLVNANLPGLFEGHPEALKAVETLAICVYRIADAMLAERARETQ